jgi:hypothetical protein
MIYEYWEVSMEERAMENVKWNMSAKGHYDHYLYPICSIMNTISALRE